MERKPESMTAAPAPVPHASNEPRNPSSSSSSSSSYSPSPPSSSSHHRRRYRHHQYHHHNHPRHRTSHPYQNHQATTHLITPTAPITKLTVRGIPLRAMAWPISERHLRRIFSSRRRQQPHKPAAFFGAISCGSRHVRLYRELRVR
ncbi:uncharacterized protein BO97DRAFT_429653 [Aspergillus homomorphus CBS 101889]|uniref:Uncharacterized protein n=1 Tax=Aspergillus homomorphus (strain CBS 101889) TaxID=1450537 RepID=A0A395HHS0_ASPHC|nr:hypothetical protein BO97DRAFT_429653 [Aspergillus homomorphus CBS 101889]RAL07053.1 hypothetical protein BO97DRAFT_429653 [Aspergillus homomorphus CBS 101889]